MVTLGVLISGRGSNLQAILRAIADGRLSARVAVVVSNIEGAPGLAHASAAGVPTVVISHRGWPSREEYDAHLVGVLRAHHVELVCLAGFMRRLTPVLIDAFPHRVLNVHPSLLPAFPGVDAQRQALEYGVRVAGCTVHLVTPTIDAGPIVLQACVPVTDDDTADTLAARILEEEHRVYPEAIRLVSEGLGCVEGRRWISTGRAAPLSDADGRG